MQFIVDKMEYVVDGIVEGWNDSKEAILELADLGVAIIKTLGICVFLLTIPVWIIPYLIYRRRNKRSEEVNE